MTACYALLLNNYDMKTNGFIYILSIIFAILMASCDDEHEMTKYKDTVSFVEDYYFVSAKADFTSLAIPVTHRSINTNGSKAEIQVVVADGTPANLVTLDKTVVSFDSEDTVMVNLSLDYNSLVEDQVFSVTLQFTDKYLEHGFGGYDEVVVEMTKWRARRMSDFVGTYNVHALSNYQPGAWDESWTVTTTADATDPNKLLLTGIAGSDVAVEAIMDFENLSITIPYGQDVGDVYGYGATVLYNSNADLDILVSDLTGTLFENNNFVIDYRDMYEADQGWDWDIFTPTFTKSASK